MKLIVISPSGNVEEETRKVTALFEHGLETFHLRKPNMRTGEMRHYLEAIPAHFHPRIVLHSHHGLASDFGLRGVHLTRYHLKQPLTNWLRMKILYLRNPRASLSTTFHKLGSLYENKRAYNYILLGTIFDPVSGNFNAGFSEHSLRAALSRISIPVVARGGTHADNVGTCAQLGFAGIAYSSAIWKKTDPVVAFAGLLTRFRELNLSVE
jgi:thiamine-phosphate pyrophosphorylase